MSIYDDLPAEQMDDPAVNPVPDRVIDAPIPEDLKHDYELATIAYPDVAYHPQIARLIERIARLEAEKQDAHTEGWNAAIEAAAAIARSEEVTGTVEKMIRELSKPTAEKQGEPS